MAEAGVYDDPFSGSRRRYGADGLNMTMGDAVGMQMTEVQPAPDRHCVELVEYDGLGFSREPAIFSVAMIHDQIVSELAAGDGRYKEIASSCRRMSRQAAIDHIGRDSHYVIRCATVAVTPAISSGGYRVASAGTFDMRRWRLLVTSYCVAERGEIQIYRLTIKGRIDSEAGRREPSAGR